jgi:ribosomal protein S8
MNLQIITLLLQLKNISLLNKEFCQVKLSKKNLILVNFLYKENFIQSFFITKKKSILLFIRYFTIQNFFKNLKFISIPSLSYFFKYTDICNFTKKKKIFIFSTTQGILTSNSCKEQKIGGKLLFCIY